MKNPNPSKKQTPTKNCQNYCLLPKEPSNQPNNQPPKGRRPSRKPDGYNNINSSTFDTLLSSQESHTPTTNPNRASLRGNLQKLTGVISACQFGLNLSVSPSRHAPVEPSRAASWRTPRSSSEPREGWPPGPGSGPFGLAPGACGDRENIMRSPPDGQIEMT
ncbi:hypothetical protein BJ980_001184 [Nocardioides daedukensis]|uniref:Uncharacterized protein n=1 Tax=Nocardioides daedukensis TaxID=634462 RepID=A0A7Y9RZC7_9ACTN|nr:hypothetical protein [Nocardioides daedukensis]